MTGIDPYETFSTEGSNVGCRIAKRTLPTRRSLCAAVIGSLVRFLRCKRTWEEPPQLEDADNTDNRSHRAAEQDGIETCNDWAGIEQYVSANGPPWERDQAFATYTNLRRR